MKKLLTLAVMALLVFTGCEKGPKGDPGNANVIGTEPFVVIPSDWQLTGLGLVTTIDAPEVTADVAANGLVMMYMQMGNNVWTPLPFTLNDVTFSYSFDPGFIDITAANAFAINSSMTFRFVVVPSYFRQANPNVDWSNYEHVKHLISKYDVIKVRDVKPATQR